MISLLNKLPDWLRWILVLPCAIAALLVIYPVVKIGNNICTTLFTGEQNGLFFNLIVSIMANGASAAGFVYVGAKVAPRHNFTVSLVLAVMLACFFGTSIMSQVILGDKSSTPWFELIVAIISSLIFAIVTVKQFHDEEYSYQGEVSS